MRFDAVVSNENLLDHLRFKHTLANLNERRLLNGKNTVCT